MDAENYRHSYCGNNKHFIYFKERPLKDWNYESFKDLSTSKRNPQSKTTLLKAYKHCLNQIQSNKDTPPNVKDRVAKMVKEIDDEIPPTIPVNTYNLSKGSIINYGHSNIKTVFNEQPSSQPLSPPSAQQQQQQQQQTEQQQPQQSQKTKGKRRQEDVDDDNNNNDFDLSDDDYDICLDENNILRLQKKTKTYRAIAPGIHLISPHKPHLQNDDFMTLKCNFDIILTEHQSSSSTAYSQQIYKENKAQQGRNQSLTDLPGTFKFLNEALKQPLAKTRQYVWTNGYTDDEDESMNNDLVRHILTDFYITSNITNNNGSILHSPSNERTPFSEHLIPIFKIFAGITHLMKFTWCEKGLVSNRLLSLCLPNRESLRSLLDGVGMSIKDGTERLLIESSGENIEHAEEDTIKQICNTSSCLKMDMKKYQDASFNTFRRRQVFGLQYIHDRMTLTTTRITDEKRYLFVEIRSATIPTSYKDRWQWIKVFELLFKLKSELIEQEKVTDLLEMESSGSIDVELTVKDMLK